MEGTGTRRGRRPKADAKIAQVNIRMDPALKASGDAVLGRLDLKASDVVRALYEYLVREQELPQGLVVKSSPDAEPHWAAEGAGLAWKLLRSEDESSPDGGVA